MSDGIEKRKEELFATVTLLNATQQRIYELQEAKAPAVDIAPLYARLATLATDKERLSYEVNAEYQARNLLHFMDRMEGFDQGRKQEAAQIISAIGGVQGKVDALHGMFSEMAETVSDHGLRLSDHADQIAALQKRLEQHEARLDGHDQRIDAVERDIADIRRDIAADRSALRNIRGKS